MIMTDTKAIDERVNAMSKDERRAYLENAGWQWVGAGYIPPGPQDPSGVIFKTDSGLYSLTTAIHEVLAREDPLATPDANGRYYHEDHEGK
jgi:hypothetical protein